MSILSTIKGIFGQSATASENHFIDGSVANKLSIKRGTPASPGAEVLKIDAGVVSFPNQVQTWQDVAGSRALDTTYTNSTGQPITVAISLVSSAVSNLQVLIAGVYVVIGTVQVAGTRCAGSVEVPAGSTYYASLTSGTPSSILWKELR